MIKWNAVHSAQSSHDRLCKTGAIFVHQQFLIGGSHTPPGVEHLQGPRFPRSRWCFCTWFLQSIFQEINGKQKKHAPEMRFACTREMKIFQAIIRFIINTYQYWILLFSLKLKTNEYAPGKNGGKGRQSGFFFWAKVLFVRGKLAVRFREDIPTHEKNNYTLPETNSWPLKIGRAPQGKAHLATVDFQGLC